MFAYIASGLISLIVSYLAYLFTNQYILSWLLTEFIKSGSPTPYSNTLGLLTSLLILLAIISAFILLRVFDRKYKFAGHINSQSSGYNNKISEHLGDAVKDTFSKYSDETRRKNIEYALSRIQAYLNSNSKNLHIALSVHKYINDDSPLQFVTGVNENGIYMMSDDRFNLGEGFCGWAAANKESQSGRASKLFLFKDRRFKITSKNSKKKCYISMPIIMSKETNIILAGVLNLSSTNKAFATNSEECIRIFEKNMLVANQYIGYNLLHLMSGEQLVGESA